MIRFREGKKRRHNEELMRMQDILYNTGPDEDEYAKKVEAAVKKAEDWYRDHLR